MLEDPCDAEALQGGRRLLQSDRNDLEGSLEAGEADEEVWKGDSNPPAILC